MNHTMTKRSTKKKQTTKKPAPKPSCLPLGTQVMVDFIPCVVVFVNQGRSYLAPIADGAQGTMLRAGLAAFIMEPGTPPRRL